MHLINFATKLVNQYETKKSLLAPELEDDDLIQIEQARP
jgi:hypothetical protein